MGSLGPGKDSLVTSEDVNELLSQPSPRKIPKKILKKAYGGSAGFLAIGSFFAALGLFFSVLLSDGLAFLLSSFVTLVGLSSIYLAMRYRQSKERLLRDGRCEAFKVKDVRASNTYENNTRVFFVTVVGVAGTILLNVHREAATMARTRKERGKPIKVLVDSVDPSKVLWVEAWAIDACINADISD